MDPMGRPCRCAGPRAIQLTNVGWDEIDGALPDRIVFYVILPLLFRGLPISKTLIYRHAFGVRFLAVLWRVQPYGLVCRQSREESRE